MNLEDVRLLIVVDQFNPEDAAAESTHLPASLPASLPTKLSAPAEADELTASRAVDLHILQSAIYWRAHLQAVAIYAACSPKAYNELSAGVRLLGSGLADLPEQSRPTAQSKIRTVADYCPTHLVICTPDAAVISWAARNEIPSVVLLCDWREPLGWQQQWQHRQLIKQLNQPSIAWVGAHGAYACKILCASGIDPHKLIPWEWPQPQLPFQDEPRQLRYDRDTIKLLYVGPIHATAGVDDLLQAVSHLHQRNRATYIKLICETSDEKPASGSLPIPTPAEDDPLHSRSQQIEEDALLGAAAAANRAPSGASLSASAETERDVLDRDLRRLKALVEQLGLTDYVTFTPALARTKRSEAKLLAEMRATDLVVMPGYDRSWPAAVPPSLQLAMATRTPVIASDHDHFKEHLFHGVNAMIFPEGNFKSMAHRIERVMSQPQLYAQLSEAIDMPLHAIKVPARWADLINRWLQSSEAPPIGTRSYQQLCNWAFSSGRYQGIAPMQKPPENLRKRLNRDLHPSSPSSNSPPNS